MAVDALQIERLVALHGGHDVVVFDVDGQQAECRDVARVRRDQRGLQPENVDEPARLQRPRAAERDQHVVARVQPASDRDLAHGVGLVPGGDLEHACRGALGAEPDRRGQLADALLSEVHVERNLAAEQVRWNSPEHEYGVGYCRDAAAAPVTHRARVGAGAVGPNLEPPVGRAPGDRAAARAHRHHVRHRNFDGVPADPPVGRDMRRAVLDNRDVGAGATTVQRQNPFEACRLSQQRPATRKHKHGYARRLDQLAAARVQHQLTLPRLLARAE